MDEELYERLCRADVPQAAQGDWATAWNIAVQYDDTETREYLLGQLAMWTSPAGAPRREERAEGIRNYRLRLLTIAIALATLLITVIDRWPII